MTAIARQCSAMAKRTGAQCRRKAIIGGSVCHVHGGAAPQVKAKARERLKELQDPAIDRLADLLSQATHLTIHTKDGPTEVPLITGNPAAILGAARTVLDRTGLSETQRHEHSGPDGGPIPTQDLSRLSDEDLGALEAILAKAEGAD